MFRWLALCVVVVACSDAESVPPGSEGGSCIGPEGCDPGLRCLSDLCVDASGGGQPADGSTSNGTSGSGGGTTSGDGDGDGDADGDGADVGGDSGPGPSAGSEPTPATVESWGCDGFPSLAQDVIPIFQRTCGSGNVACHARNAYGANSGQDCRGWLTLEDEALGSVFYAGDREGEATGCPDMVLYERLTQLDAWQCESFDARVRYVVPCDPSASYLYRKIGGGPYCTDANGDVTAAMPMDAEMPADELATITAWINAGAPRTCDAALDCGASPAGSPPEARINHPGAADGARQVDVPIPFVGVATDAEDGALTGSALVWTSDLEGTEIGTGESFEAALTVLGVHTITLTATDSDGNETTATVMVEIVP